MKETRNNYYRKNAIMAGALLLAAIVTGVVGKSLTLGITSGPDVLANIAAHPARFAVGEFFFILMAFCCTGIAVWLYPTLKRHNPAMAAGALVFRTIEGGIFIIQAALQIGLVALAEQAVSAEGALLGNYQFTVDVLMSITDKVGAIGGALAFCFGALLYYTIMTRSGLVPRWLSLWGVAAILFHIVEIILVLFGEDSTSTIAMILNIPIFFNELTLAVWLIARGFNDKAIQGSIA